MDSETTPQKQSNPRYPFFRTGMKAPREVHQEYRIRVLDLLMKDRTPYSQSKVAQKLGFAEVTAAKILQELTMEGKLVCNWVGSARVFQIDENHLAEMLNSVDTRKQ